MRRLGFVAAATLALMGGSAIAKTTIVYAGHLITDASKPAKKEKMERKKEKKKNMKIKE